MNALLLAGFQDVPSEFLKNIMVFLAAAGAFALILKKLFWDKSPLPIRLSGDQLADQQKTLEDLKLSLKGLAPNEKIEELLRKYAECASRHDIEALRKELDDYVDQEQLDRRMAAFERQLEKLERDLSADIKGFRDDAMTFWREAERQREGLHHRMGAHAEALAEIRGTIGRIDSRV